MRRPRYPNELRKMPRLLRAAAWRLPLEFGELLRKLRYRPIDRCLNKDKLIEHVAKREEAIEETAVTTGQRKLLFGAVTHTEKMPEAIAEIGAWRGITTAAPAGRTVKRVYAIDHTKKTNFLVSMKPSKYFANEPPHSPTWSM